jgi:hypothetical protein
VSGRLPTKAHSRRLSQFWHHHFFIDKTNKTVFDYEDYLKHNKKDYKPLKGASGPFYARELIAGQKWKPASEYTDYYQDLPGPFEFSEGLLPINGLDDGEYAVYVDSKGTAQFKIKAYPAEHFSEGLAKVGTGGANTMMKKYGFIDRHGKFVIDPTAQDVAFDEFSDGVMLFRSEVSFQCDLIDTSGKKIATTAYACRAPFHEGLALVGISTAPPPQNASGK